MKTLLILIVLSASAFGQCGIMVWNSQLPGGGGMDCTGPAGAGSGTVTSVGFTGGLLSVATATSTPAITVAGTSGGIPYFSSASAWASSGVLGANLPLFGGGAGASPIAGTRSGNTTQVVTTTGAQTNGDCVKIDANGNHIANGSACGSGGSGTVTSVGWTGGIVSVATATTTPALTIAGTSGGIPYFSGATTWASSGALTANLPVIGGGAGVAPTVGTRSGNTTAFVTTTGTQTSGDCVTIDSSGNHIAAGSACGSAGGDNPVGGLGALQLYATSTTFTGDNTKLFSRLTAITPTQPVSVTPQGTPGAVTYTYAQQECNLSGCSVLSTVRTTTTGVDDLSGAPADFNRIVLAAVVTAGNTLNLWITATDSMTMTVGLVAEGLASGATYDDTSGGNGSLTAGLDGTAGLYISQNLKSLGHMALGSESGLNGGSLFGPVTSAVLNIEETMTGDLTLEGLGVMVLINADPSVDGGFISAGNFIMQSDPGNSTHFDVLLGFQNTVDHQGTGIVDHAQASAFPILNSSTGTLTDARAVETQIGNFGLGTITTARHIWVATTQNTGGGTVTNNIGVQIDDQSGVGSTISRNLWSRGATATNLFEGIVEIDTLTTTGAASGKNVVCVDTTTGQLYASSSDKQCLNTGSGSAGTVTSVGFTGGLLSVATATTTPAITVAGTSGGIPYFSSTSAWASSGALTANLPVIGGGAGTAPSVGTRSGNTTAFVTTTGAQTNGDCVKIDANGNHVANGSACGSGGSGTVTSVGWTGGIVSVATATTTPAFTIAGTSGGIPYFSGASTWATSAALTANLPVIGGGAGAAPTVGTRSGNTTAFVTTTGTQTSGDCVTIDANGNHIANGSACGSASVTAGTGISVAGSTVNNVAPRFLVLDDSAGGTDTYTGTSIVGFPAAYASMVIDFVPLAATTSASTLNVNAIGALAIKQADCTTDTATNDLLAGRAYPLRLKTGSPNVWCMFP